jgi:hypothetical protein
MRTLNGTTVFNAANCVAFGSSFFCGRSATDKSLLGLLGYSYGLAVQLRRGNVCLLSVLFHFEYDAKVEMAAKNYP